MVSKPRCRSRRACPCSAHQAKVVLEVDPGELAAQVDLVALAVGRVVEHGVDVGEDVLGPDFISINGVVAVVLAELPQPPLGDVADPLAVRRVAVEGEALGIAGEVPISQLVCPMT